MAEGRRQVEPNYANYEDETPQKSRVFLFLVLFVIVLLVVGGVTLFQRKSQYKALADTTEKLAIPTVSVIHPTPEAGQEDLVLPSTLQAYVESPIYARTTGYVKKWYHDIGTRVRAGEPLADIDTPEVDQQLSQARAELATAQANANLSRITATRLQELIKTDGVSKQEVDNAVGDLAAKEAIVNSAEANVRRLQELEGFKHVAAPFSGVITRRQTDIGQLVNAGNGGASQELFSLSQTDPLRVYVNVPEAYAPSIHAGLPAYLELTQYAGKKFEGKVVRTAESIELASRTLRAEVDVPNHAGELLPGGYAQVHLAVQVGVERVQVPVNALLFRAEGLRAIVVDGNHKLRLQPITIGRDYGTTLEVLQGITSSDWIVLNPADSLDDGETVNVKEMQQKPAPAPANSQAPSPANQGAKPAAKSGAAH